MVGVGFWVDWRWDFFFIEGVGGAEGGEEEEGGVFLISRRTKKKLCRVSKLVVGARKVPHT